MCVVIDETVIEGIWIPEKEYRIFEEMQLSSLSILLHCRQYVTPNPLPGVHLFVCLLMTSVDANKR